MTKQYPKRPSAHVAAFINSTTSQTFQSSFLSFFFIKKPTELPRPSPGTLRGPNTHGVALPFP
jgi:hypothetical protein